MEYAQPKYQGDPTIASLANGLGTLGRYGDSYMVHAAEGETVIPAEILAANPELKNQLFWQMRMMGIQDPNRYVVGNNLNSINPLTGQPEFFFKKAWRSVKKAVKKALPYIAAAVGNYIAPGIGGPIASGLVTKFQGGTWGDAAKSAAFAYGTQAAMQGLQGGIAGLGPEGQGFGSGFAEGLGKGVVAPFQAAGNIFAGTPFDPGTPATQNPLAQGAFGPRGMNIAFPEGAAALTQLTPQTGYEKLFPTYQTGARLGDLGIDPQTGLFSTPQTGSSWGPGQSITKVAGEGPSVFATEKSGRVRMFRSADAARLQAKGKLAITPEGNILTPDWKASLTQSAPLAPTGGGAAPAEQFTSKSGQLYDILPSGKYIPVETPKPSFFSAEGLQQAAGTAAKTLALPVALGAAAYLMTPDPDELTPDEIQQLTNPQQSAYEKYTARGRLKDATGLALLVEAGISPTQDAATLSRNWGIPQENAQNFLDSFYGAAPSTTATGGIAGLQGGGEIMGPGSGTSDSIPARLSDGEFVMTADAVRGIGNGNRNLGAARMYDLMSRYENGVA
jgi:hypothetical protein